MRTALLISIAAGVSRLVLFSAVGQQTPTFSTDVRVVNLVAAVRDAQGKLVYNLSKSDFRLSDNGREQAIGYFSQQTDLPLTLGLLVDTSASMLRVLDTERDASKGFFKQVLREDRDKAFLVHFDRSVELMQGLTSSRRKLDSSLGALDSQTWFQRHMSGKQVGTASTALYDAVTIAAHSIMAKQTGRKALVVLSDGMDSGSRASLELAIEAAQRADTLVYAIHIYNADTEGPMSAAAKARRDAELARGKEVLRAMSRTTGGALFEILPEHPIQQTFQEIEQELRNQYSLGFTPAGVSQLPGFHSLHLTTVRNDLTVQARDGYYVGN
ncbi:MAG TPA: VWA domain-containing protein [Bryobacteraceae bacterium]|nr:VWA domain-containing protein [Bryobacteraceae bacterium]